MPKPTLIPDQHLLELELIDTMLAGLHNWRPDLSYPQSHSDMMGCARAIMVMFDVKRSPLPNKLYRVCDACGGSRYFSKDAYTKITCTKCDGSGKIETAP